VSIASIAVHALLKFIRGQVIQELSEDGTTGVHPPFCGGAGLWSSGAAFCQIELQIEKSAITAKRLIYSGFPALRII
jgi:hypothetical protein